MQVYVNDLQNNKAQNLTPKSLKEKDFAEMPYFILLALDTILKNGTSYHIIEFIEAHKNSETEIVCDKGCYIFQHMLLMVVRSERAGLFGKTGTKKECFRQ